MSMIEVDHHSSGVLGGWFLGGWFVLMTHLPNRSFPRAAASSSCDVLPREIVNLALRITELGQNVVGVGTELWWRHCGPGIAACQPKARADHLNRPADAGGISERPQQLALDNLRMLEHRRHVEYLAGRNTMLIEECGPFAGGLAGKRRLDFGVEREAVALAILPSGKARIVDKVLAADQAAEGLELLLFVGCDVEGATASAQRSGWARGHVLIAHRLRPHARDQPVRDHPTHRNQRRFQHRYIDDLALAAALAPVERRRDRKSRRDAAHGVGNRVADAQGCGLAISSHAHHAGQSLHDLIVGRIELEWTVLAKSGDCAIDQVRPHLLERRIAEPETLHDAGPKVLDHDAGGGNQLAEYLAALRSLEIERERALAGILRQ